MASDSSEAAGIHCVKKQEIKEGSKHRKQIFMFIVCLFWKGREWEWEWKWKCNERLQQLFFLNLNSLLWPNNT